MRTRRASAVVVALIVVGLLGSGCNRVSTTMSDSSESVPTDAQAHPILVTQEWGVVDGMLSVVVRNTTNRTLRTAEAVITARDRNDVPISSSLEDLDAVCCSVVDLPPGQDFGLYVDIGEAADGIRRVDVAYRDIAWSPAGGAQTSTLDAQPVRLDGNGHGAIVVASVQASEPVAHTSVQAFLVDPDGRFLAVVSGRWYCFSEGNHEIRMQLLHPVPAGTTVDRMAIHPVTDDPDGRALHCAGPAQTG